MTLPQPGPPAPPRDHFSEIADALRDTGWVLIPDFLDSPQWLSLLARARTIGDYGRAGIGRDQQFHTNGFVRKDRIFWLRGEDPADREWLSLMETLRLTLNRELFMGLFEFESHYARYDPGSFYKRHLDAFEGQGNRMVSVVLYLNPDWQPPDGGEFVIYPHRQPEGVRFLPRAGSLAVFLSEEFPHEVLAARRTRYSIAGWFRINGSSGGRADPPR